MAVVLILESSGPLKAEAFIMGELEISNVWARETIGRARTAAVYVTKIHNSGKHVDSLISIRSPIAIKSSIHKIIVESGVAKMRQVKVLEIPVDHSINLKPGGLHIMMVGIQKPLKEGASFPLTFEFKKAGKIEVVVKVKKIGSSELIKMEHKKLH